MYTGIHSRSYHPLLEEVLVSLQMIRLKSSFLKYKNASLDVNHLFSRSFILHQALHLLLSRRYSFSENYFLK